MPVSTKRRTPPAIGTAKWVGVDPNGNHILRITSATKGGPVVADYEVECVVCGYDLHRIDVPDTTYHVRYDSVGCMSCDCPDATNARDPFNYCKHARGLKAAMVAEPF